MTMRLIGTPKILSPYGAGSTIWFYEPSTTTKKDVYSDASLTTPISQTSGIAADADGFWPTIYCSAALYRIIVKDSDGVTKQDEDNFDPGLAAGFGVSSVVGIAQGGTGANNAPQARINLGAASASSLSAIQDDVTELQTQIAPGLNGSNVLGVVAALASIARSNLASSFGNVVVQSVDATPYTSNAALSTGIPLDDTTPLISEGNEILTANITPTSSGNKIRITLSGFGGANSYFIYVIFRNTTCIFPAVGVNNNFASIATVYIDSPATTSQVTYSVRVGSPSGDTRMNGNLSGRYFNGTAKCTMRLEEIETH